jgi:hypothetical protein
MNRSLLTAALLAFISPVISAENYIPKFDQGVDLKEFIKAATAFSLQTCTPFPPTTFSAVKTTRLMKELPKPRAGSYFGPLRPIVTGNKTYPYAQKYPPLIQPSQDPAAKELMIQWENIENARTLLLDEAQGLETKDAQLYADAEQIEQNAAALNKEIEAWEAEAAAYNQQCAGQPVNTNCTNWYNKLVSWQEDLKQRIAAHNANYDAWKQRAQALTDSVNGWKGKVNIWEQAMLYFIEKAQIFLKDTGKCTYEEWEELQDAVDNSCHSGLDSSCKQWHPSEPTLDCSTWRAYLARNIACYAARHDINTKCYDGGDPGHQEAEQNALNAMANCQGLITKFCVKTYEPTIPERKYGF